MRDSECIVKGIVLMGTPLRGSNQATLFTPYIKAIKQLNIYTAMNDNLIKSLSAHQPNGISDIVLRFQTVIEEREIKLVICCEETPVAGTELVSRSSARILTSKLARKHFATNVHVTKLSLIKRNFCPDHNRRISQSHLRPISHPRSNP